MKGFVQDIEDLAVKNDEFRRVLYTAKHCQLVVMALKPKEEIGAEVHTLDQFFRVEAGTVRRFSTAFGRRSGRASRSSSRPGRITTSSIPAVATEALYALCAAESSGRRCPPYPRRRGGRQRTFRRQDDGVGSRLEEGRTVMLILLIVVLVRLFGGGGGYYPGRGRLAFGLRPFLTEETK